MADITVIYRDGTKREFRHTGRPGGSYTKTVKYEGAFVVITDEWDAKTVIPAELIQEVKVDPGRYW